MNNQKESGKQVKNNIKITDRHESLKHDSMKEHKRSKLLFEVKIVQVLQERGQKQDN